MIVAAMSQPAEIQFTSMEWMAEYDRWANGLWRTALGTRPIGDKSDRLAALPTPETTQVLAANMEFRGWLRGQAELAKWKVSPQTDFTTWVRTKDAIDTPEMVDVCIALLELDSSGWTTIAADVREGRPHEIFVHHAGCACGWGQAMAKALGEGWPPEEPSEPARTLEQSLLCWKSLVVRYPLSSVYTWKRPVKGDLSWSLDQLAVHVPTHGFYHRGQIRALHEASGKTAV